MKNCHVINNDYLCGENIRFAMTQEIVPLKLISVLVKKFNLINDAQVIERIEKAVCSYYEITIEDLQKINIVNYDAYVYIYMHPHKEGRWHIYGNEYIYNKPLYVGKGHGDRKEAHLQYTLNSELDLALKALIKAGDEPIIKVYNMGCTHEMAFNLENYIIARLREQNVDLCNATTQSVSEKYVKKIEISTFNLETILNSVVLDALNSSHTHKEAASLLGISERTLYRKVRSLGIFKLPGYSFRFGFKLNKKDRLSVKH